MPIYNLEDPMRKGGSVDLQTVFQAPLAFKARLQAAVVSLPFFLLRDLYVGN